MSDSSYELTIDTDSLTKVSNKNKWNNSNPRPNTLDKNQSDTSKKFSLNKVCPKDFEHDSLDKLQSLNFDRDSLDGKLDIDSLDSHYDSIERIEEQFITNETGELNKQRGQQNGGFADKPRGNNERHLNELGTVADGKVFYEKENRGSKVALDIPCDEAYEFDKFDRFFSAFDFFREPPPVSVKKTGGGISRTEKTKTGRKDFTKKKIPLLSYTIARNEKKKCSYLEMYKKKCSRKLKKVMKDTELKSEIEGNGSAASDQCSVSSKLSVGSEINENQGKGDGVNQRDEDQYYYDVIQKYEQHSIHRRVGYTTSGTFGSNRHDNTNNILNVNSSNHSNRTNPSNVNNPSSHGNINNVSCPDNTSNTRIRVSDIVKNLNQVTKQETRSTVTETNSSNDVKLIYMKETKDLNTTRFKNANIVRQKAHSYQNVSRPPVYSIPSQKSMPTPGTHMQLLGSQRPTTVSRLPKFPPHTQRPCSSAPVQSKLSLGKQNSMAKYPSSIQSMVKVYPLSKVYPSSTRTMNLSSNISEVSIPPELNQSNVSMEFPKSVQDQTRQNSTLLGDGGQEINPIRNEDRRTVQTSTTNLRRFSIVKRTLDKQSLPSSITDRKNEQHKQSVGKSTLKKSVLTQKTDINECERLNQHEMECGDQKSQEKNICSEVKQRQQEIIRMERKSQLEISNQLPQRSEKDLGKQQREIRVKQKQPIVQLEGQRELSKQAQQLNNKVVLKQEKSQQTVSKPLKINQSKVKKTDSKSQQELKSNINQLETSKTVQKSETEEVSTSRKGITQSSTTEEVKAENFIEPKPDGLAGVKHAVLGKTTQSEETFRGIVETGDPKRPATCSDNSRYPSCNQNRYMTAPNNMYSRHFSKPKKSYLEIYQQKKIFHRIPVPVAKSKLKPKKVVEKEKEKVEKEKDKRSKNENKERNEKTLQKKDDASKAGGEGPKLAVIKRRYTLKKKVTSKEETTLNNSLEDEQVEKQLKYLEEKQENLKRQLNTIKSKPRAPIIDA